MIPSTTILKNPLKTDYNKYLDIWEVNIITKSELKNIMYKDNFVKLEKLYYSIDGKHTFKLTLKYGKREENFDIELK